MIVVNYTSKFIKSFRRLPAKVKQIAVARIVIFEKNPFDPKLKTHKLTGTLKGCYAFSVSYNLRVLFVFESESEATLVNIGTHEIYK